MTDAGISSSQQQQVSTMKNGEIKAASGLPGLPHPGTLRRSSTNSIFEWPTEPTAYEFLGKIGQGAFASVWRAQARCVPTTVTAAASAATATTVIAGGTSATGGAESAANQLYQQRASFSEGDDKDDVLAQSYRDCAVKVLNLDHVDTNLSEIRLEVQAMRLSSHPNVLTCCTAFVNNVNLWLVTPLMKKGSSLHCLQTARRVIRQQQQQQQPNQTPKMEDHIFYVIYETLRGLQYIHENGQIHRDIKAGNILLSETAGVCIADFGVSGWLVPQNEKAKTFVGTPCWMAPEVMEQVHGYDTKADIWSLGITALELAKGYAPYAKYPPMKVLILTIQEDPPSLESYDDDDDEDDYDPNNLHSTVPVYEVYSKQFQALVSACLQKNPSKRPSCAELLQSKYFSHIEGHLEARREAMQREVCDLVQDVGEKNPQPGQGQQGPPTSASHLPGHSPVSIVTSMTDSDRPAGTTWVFADGSQVLASSSAGKPPATVDDVMEELDMFGIQTGGEHYDAKQKEQQKADEDDLNQFMDEFEMNTAGEDFRRD